jgi:sarcosine oxidase subunit alpha
MSDAQGWTAGPDGRLSPSNRGEQIEILFDGKPVKAHQGETVAAALMATGRRHFRLSSVRSEPRGLYCGNGMCFDCVMTIDNIPNVRTCQKLVSPGMTVESQNAEGLWKAI